jgi:Mrp family chromosome partitioning ATPase
MTTTNRAFMKAYRTDEPEASPPAPRSGAARQAAPLPTAEPAMAEATPATQRSAICGPKPASAPMPRGTHQNTTRRPPDGNAQSLGNRPHGRADVSHANLRSGGEGTKTNGKQPLSSFIAATGIARLGTERADGDFFRPGTTVASFHWPEVCRTLLRNCGQQWAPITDLLMTHAAAGRSLIAVLGMNSGDGATTTAMCLAARLAERNRRVILVDGNFRKPSLAKLLEAEPTAGWQDVLKHGAPLTDAVIRATDDHLDLLALGEKIPKDAMRLASGLQAVVTAGVLRHAYDHVLLDIGAIGDTAAQSLMLELLRNMGLDAAIAVTGPRRADPGDLDALSSYLTKCGCEFLGTISNRVNG